MSSYLHGLVKFVGKEERLVLDTLNCRKRRGMQGTWSEELWVGLSSPTTLHPPPMPTPGSYSGLAHSLHPSLPFLMPPPLTLTGLQLTPC